MRSMSHHVLFGHSPNAPSVNVALPPVPWPKTLGENLEWGGGVVREMFIATSCEANIYYARVDSG